NPDIHTRTTAQEILADFEGRRLDYWVTGSGTGGTLRGVARVLKARRPGTRIVLCEPDNAPSLAAALPRTTTPTDLPPPAIPCSARTSCRVGRPISSPS